MKPQLTRRQVQIAMCVAKGMSNKQIAKYLHIKLNTVLAHVQEIARRMPGEGKPRYRLTVWYLSYRDQPANGNGRHGT